MIQSNSRSGRVLMARLLLLAIVVAGLVLRVWNVNFDRGIGSHPDERSTACFYAPTIGWPSSLAEFRNPQASPLNPLWDRTQGTRRSFTYGHFPLYLGVGMGQLWHMAAPAAQAIGFPDAAVALMARADRACDAIAVAGRVTIALLDTATIILLYLLARRWLRSAGRGPALLAAALYAFTAQAIQLSHFFAMDPASTTFTVLTVLGGVMMVQERRASAAVVTGVGAGLAIASKFSALPVLAVPVVAGGLWALAVSGSQAEEEHESPVPTGARGQLRALWAVVLALAVAGVSFFVTSPYAVLDWRSFVQATLVEQGQMVRGIADFPFTRQYRNTTPYIYFIEQQLRWGMGWPLGLTSLIGSVVMAGALVWGILRVILRRGLTWRTFARSSYAPNLLVWTWIIPYFGLTGAFLAKFNRYMSPILPFAVLMAAVMIGTLWHWRRESLRVYARALAVVVAVIALAGGALWSLAYVNGVYNREHTWITASRWIYQNAPAGSTLLWELWDDPLPKSIPGEPGMDMGSTGLRNIDWSPYEEDTPEKYAILKAKLREADFVVYSSKRIYDSVDELPERYPMTTLYYEAMWDGRLGFELAAEFTSPPRLFGREFDDRHADESWSLYDHPQVTVFRKVRDLSDAEFDALFERAWERAIPYYRGQDSPLSPLLELLGLGSSPSSGEHGLISRLMRAAAGERERATPEIAPASLQLERPLTELPVVDDYRWNRAASQYAGASVLVWWLVVGLLGVAAWPIAFVLFPGLPDRGYLLAKSLGWLVAGWLLWMAASLGLVQNTVRASWWAVLVLAVVGATVFRIVRPQFISFVRRSYGTILAGEALWTAAFLAFVLVRMANPDLWQPWFGGEKFMEFAFLNGILRSPTFPPVDPHFAGGVINYYYYGIYLVSYLVKLTGIYAEVAYNLAIPTLFAMTVGNAFAVALGAYVARRPDATMGRAMRAAWLGPLFVTIMGNLDGFAQLVRHWMARGSGAVDSALPGIGGFYAALMGIVDLLRGQATMPGYDFWGPSRVIPETINEFPYWSFLFADLHPHMIGIPFSLLFMAVLLGVLIDAGRAGTGLRSLRWGVLAFLLGALASINLWELPTYLGLGILTAAVGMAWSDGRINWLRLTVRSGAYLGLAYLLYLPFFASYVNVGASGPGWVRKGDDLGLWLLIWATLGVIIVTGLVHLVWQSGRGRSAAGGPRGQGGAPRWLGISLRRFERLPRVWYLHGLVVRQPTIGYLVAVGVVPMMLVAGVAAWLFERQVLAVCLAGVGIGLPLLWPRRRDVDAGSLLAVVLAVTGLAILAGTQVVYLKDFLQGGDWYRMNTLFKFFIQVWILWGVAAAILFPRVWAATAPAGRGASEPARTEPLTSAANTVDDDPGIAPPILRQERRTWGWRVGAMAWRATIVALIVLSCTYVVFGTPARLSQRMIGWRPPFGTLNGLAFMEQGSYTWPDDRNRIDLAHDHAAILWLLDYVRGNMVIVESSEVDYYRAGGTRVASMTGLSGLRGMHAGEQRPGSLVGERDALHREFWSTPSIDRMRELMDRLDVTLIYVGQLERHLHSDGVARLTQLAASGELITLYENERVTVYARPGRLVQGSDGRYVPGASLPSVGMVR